MRLVSGRPPLTGRRHLKACQHRSGSHMPCVGFNTKEEAMSEAANYAQFIAERAKPPPLTSGDTRHWHGRDVASQGIGLLSVSDPVAYAAVPAQEQPGLEPRAIPPPPMPMRPLRLISALPTPEIDWAMETAGLTFCGCRGCEHGQSLHGYFAWD
jgi:hypothetical protein